MQLLARKSWLTGAMSLWFLCLVQVSGAYGQDTKQDSVLRGLQTTSSDSLKIEALYELTRLYRHSDVAKAIDYANQGDRACQKDGV